MRSLTLTILASVLVAGASAGCARNSIVGKWGGTIRSRRGMSAHWTMDFKSDGTESQTIEAAGQSINIQATYTTKDSVLTQTLVSATKNGVTQPVNGRTDVLNYKVDGDTLALSQPNNASQLVFKRQ